MKKTPCEYMCWLGLPIIRKEIVKIMVNNYGLNQKEAAEKLGVTPAAVSQYLSKKRGKINIIDDGILTELNISAKNIITNGKVICPNEICRICKILRKQGILSFSLNEI
jgi:predicted transcriptional regulator